MQTMYVANSRGFMNTPLKLQGQTYECVQATTGNSIKTSSTLLGTDDPSSTPIPPQAAVSV